MTELSWWVRKSSKKIGSNAGRGGIPGDRIDIQGWFSMCLPYHLEDIQRLDTMDDMQASALRFTIARPADRRR